LRSALELAGLSPHCDFNTQVRLEHADGHLRPDCVIRLPGGRYIVVDAKVSLDTYLDGCEALDEATREACFKRHADNLRKHMLSLSRTDYWDAVNSELGARPDFVAMYVPGESFFSAAVERSSGLLNEAIERGVFIVTPITLIALAKAVALGWRQEAIAENARQVTELGRELYRRLATMGEHVVRVGRSLEDSVKAYNGFVGSLESSVLPQARRFQELEAVDSSAMLQLTELIETDVRQPARGRDLRLGGEGEVVTLSTPVRERRNEALTHRITPGTPAVSS
jgi:DNA recombination protein RmuC